MRAPRLEQRTVPPRAASGARADRRAANGRTTPDGTDDVLIAREPIVGMLQHDAERVLGEMLTAESGGNAPLDLAASGRRRWTARGVRHFLRQQEGQGYWDFFKLSDSLMLSVTDAAYDKDAWVRVEGTAFFKVRILLSGTLRGQSGGVVATAPQALLYVSPGSSREGYFISAGEPIRMVVLHCRPELMTDVLGLDADEIAPPLDSLFQTVRDGSRHRLALGPEVLHAAQRIVDSRHQLPRPMRGPYLEALSMEILLQVCGDLANREMLRKSATTLSTRDLNCIFEARDYLAQHFTKPLRIPELARLVGVNQTKLKAVFREAVGLTIYDYILKCRMERAAELLVTGDYAVAEVAFDVGYDYPANFTHAFKKFYGRLPRAMKQPAKRAR
jgi:AraC family transcriptional activator of pyochelin receptor